MTIDKEKLKALAEAATPGRHYDRLESAGGGIKYECAGDDGSLVLKVDHKNNEFGFVGDRGEADEAFFLACSPAAVLALLAEIERHEAWRTAFLAERDAQMRQRDQLRAENEDYRSGQVRYEQIIEDLKAENAQLKNQEIELRCQNELLLRGGEVLKEQAEALRKDAELVSAGRAKLAGAMSRLRAKHNDWTAPEALAAAELVWCSCGDGFPPNSYGAGFMDANNGVCWSCDAAKEASHD